MVPPHAFAGPNVELGQRYRLVRLIGQDELTATWEGMDTRLDRPVVLRLLSDNARDDVAAQTRLRQAARAPVLTGDASNVYAPRILDGGDDPILGPFLVAEFNESFEATRPLPAAASQPAPPAEAALAPASRRQMQGVSEPSVAASARGGRTGLMVLVLLVLVCLGAVVFIARLLAPSGESAVPPVATVTSGTSTRPLPGAPPAQARSEPTPVPTLATPTEVPQAIVSTPPPSPPTPQPSSRATATPIGERARVNSPAETIHEHYALIDGRRYNEGYSLMSARLRGLNSPEEYASWFANKVSIKPTAVDLVSQTEAQAVVRSVVETTDRANGVVTTNSVSEEFLLRKENGAWRIDRVTRL